MLWVLWQPPGIHNYPGTFGNHPIPVVSEMNGNVADAHKAITHNVCTRHNAQRLISESMNSRKK